MTCVVRGQDVGVFMYVGVNYIEYCARKAIIMIIELLQKHSHQHMNIIREHLRARVDSLAFYSHGRPRAHAKLLCKRTQTQTHAHT